ncbi:MAG: hypothetical protein ACU85V_12940 [Gammaproteobacteria bacterium]
MNKLIGIFALTLASNVVLAEGFSPWENRGVPADATITAGVEVEQAGFAPWRDRAQDTGIETDSVQIGDLMTSGFRPWS